MAFITYYSKWNWEEGHFVSVNSYPHHHQTPSQPPNPTQESPEFVIGIFGNSKWFSYNLSFPFYFVKIWSKFVFSWFCWSSSTSASGQSLQIQLSLRRIAKTFKMSETTTTTTTIRWEKTKILFLNRLYTTAFYWKLSLTKIGFSRKPVL